MRCLLVSIQNVDVDGVIFGSNKPLSVVRLCGINLIPNVALDMSRSLHRSIPCFLKGEQGGFKD